MPKKKPEKEVKVKKQSAKKASVKGPQPAVVPAVVSAVVAVVKAKEKKPKPRKPEVAKAVEISSEDIALRAYYITERREKLGWHGDSTGDWVEAERQLRTEAAKKK